MMWICVSYRAAKGMLENDKLPVMGTAETGVSPLRLYYSTMRIYVMTTTTTTDGILRTWACVIHMDTYPHTHIVPNSYAFSPH